MSFPRVFHRAIVVLCFLGVAGTASSQIPRDKEIRGVPAEVRARIQLYFDLRQKKDWAKLFDVDDGPIRNKDDYVNMQIADETNPYIRVRKITAAGLNDSMFYWASSKKWEIEGCSRFTDKEGVERTAQGTIWVSVDDARGWIVNDALPAWWADGWRECSKPLAKFPIRINF